MKQDFNFEIVNCMPEGGQYHAFDQLIYVLDGELSLHLGSESYVLNKNSLMFIRSFRKHKWTCENRVVVAIYRFGNKLFQNVLQTGEMTIECNSCVGTEMDYSNLRKLCLELLLEFMIHENEDTARKNGLFYLILDDLQTHFAAKRSFGAACPESEEAFEQVLRYVYDNYTEPLTQDTVAKAFYMSPSVFSRYFKKNTGINFSDYMLCLRLSSACEALQDERMKVTDIAVDCGFSSASAFNKFFKKHYHMTPGEYRNALSEQPRVTTGLYPDAQAKDTVQLFLEAHAAPMGDERISACHVIVDVSNRTLRPKVWTQALNVGAAEELLSGEQQRHVLLLKRILDFKYIRILNVFSRAMHIRRDFECMVLNFDLVDNVLDFLVRNGINVILDLGNKKKAIVRSGADRLYELREDAIFSGLEDAEVFIKRFISHLLMRYGKEVVSHWIFEITYEESAYAPYTTYTFPQYFGRILPLLKARIPEAMAGIYGSTPGMNEFEYIKTWKAMDVQPDFISISVLPYRPVTMPGGRKVAKRSMDLMYLNNLLIELRQNLKEEGLSHLKVFATEWNLNISDRNILNDSQEYAALLLDMMNRLYSEVDFGVFTFGSDLTLRYFESSHPFFGGKGLLSKDGLIKPSCYALSFYSKLERYLIQKGNGYIITCNDNGRYVILCYNAKTLTWNFYRKSESQIGYDDMEDMFVDHMKLKLTFYMTGLENGAYVIKKHILDKCNSVMEQWRLLGNKDSLDYDELEYLTKVCIPRRVHDEADISDGRWTLDIVLEPHEIQLIEMTPVV